MCAACPSRMRFMLDLTLPLRRGNHILGDTTTRSIPSGGVLGPAAWPPTPPRDCKTAYCSTVQGVRTQFLLFKSAFFSSSEAECVTTVTPAGCPPTVMAVGKSDEFGGIGTGAVTSHLASC